MMATFTFNFSPEVESDYVISDDPNAPSGEERLQQPVEADAADEEDD